MPRSAPPSADRACDRVLRAYPFAFALFCLILNLRVDFQQWHNDFWDVFFVARHLAWNDRQSWFNPQYPMGYTLFLKTIMGHGLPVVPAIMANMVFGMAILMTCARFFRQVLPPIYALPALVALSFFPQFFRYTNVGGGDPGAMAFFTLGAMLLLKECTREIPRPKWFFTAGILLGTAALFRYHALVADAMLLLAVFCVWPKYWKALVVAGTGVGLAYSPEWAVNLAAGKGLLETQFGPMNVYDLMYGLNWARATDLRLPASALDIIRQDPALFARKYFLAVWTFKQAYLPPLFAASFEKDARWRPVAKAVALWVVLYFALFSATTSGRQILLPLPFTFLCVGLSLRILWQWGSRAPGFVANPRFRFCVLLVLGLLPLTLSAKRDYQFSTHRAQLFEMNKNVETYLWNNGCRKANEVFSNDFDLYFRSLPKFVPDFNGGAPRWGTYLYNQEYPEYPVDSLDAFVAVCRKRGVHFVVLNADCPQLSRALGDLYQGETKRPGLKLDWTQDAVQIYRVL